MADTITPDAVDTGSITLDDLNINDTVPSTAANPETPQRIEQSILSQPSNRLGQLHPAWDIVLHVLTIFPPVVSFLVVLVSNKGLVYKDPAVANILLGVICGGVGQWVAMGGSWYINDRVKGAAWKDWWLKAFPVLWSYLLATALSTIVASFCD